MGPATEITKARGSLDPPMFKPEGDLLEWRRKVARWADLIASAAKKGTDNHYQTVFATLGRQLYGKGLSSPQQSLVDEAQSKNKINYKQDDQVKAVIEIVDLFADEQPTAMVTHRITSFNRVAACRRRKNEDLQTFVSRFQGLAADHLMLAGGSSSSQMVEVFAITLLNNADLSDFTLTNAKLQLVGMAKARVEDGDSKADCKDISLSLLHRIEKLCGHLSNLVSDVTVRGTSKAAYKKLANDLVRNVMHVSDRLNEATTKLSEVKHLSEPEDRTSQLLLSSTKQYTLHLDDAVSVLKSLSHTNKASTTGMSRSDIEELVGKRVEKALLSIQKSAPQGKRPFSNKYNNRSGSAPRGQGPSQGDAKPSNSSYGNKGKTKRDPGFCMDCGSERHRRGDLGCQTPSFMTKKMRSDRGDNQGIQKKTGTIDPNPVVDIGCPRNVGGVESAAALSVALGIPFKLRELDCQPFFHGYGMHCSEAELLFAIWNLPITDLGGNKVNIPFYVTPGKGILLVGNQILHQSKILGDENLLVVPPGVCGLSMNGMSFETYTDAVSLRTYLHVVPAQQFAFKTFFASVRSYSSLYSQQHPSQKSKYSDGKAAKRFAVRLHGYTHLPLNDMKMLCKRAGVLTPMLKQGLEAAVNKCTSCKTTGRPLRSRKISFARLLMSFNEHVQLDFMFLPEMNNLPILHLVDASTGFSCTSLMSSREKEHVAREVEVNWINHHGRPAVMSGDPEYRTGVFKQFLNYYNVKFEDRPARRHNKTGVVESKNAIIRIISQRLLMDSEYFTLDRATHASWEEILSRATYLSNILYGGKRISSFEMVRGYTPSIGGLPQCRISSELIATHQEQVAMRAINKLRTTRDVHTLTPAELPRNTPVFYYKRGKKTANWVRAFVREADDYIVTLSSNSKHVGMPVRAAYEDIRLAPRSSLLYEMDCEKVVFPRSDMLEDVDDSPVPIQALSHGDVENVNTPTPSQETDDIPDALPLEEDLTKATEVHKRNEAQDVEVVSDEDVQSLPALDLGDFEDLLVDEPQAVTKESALWATHALLSSNTTSKHCDDPSLDVGKAYDPPRVDKDIGNTELKQPPSLPCELQSAGQTVLKQIHDVIDRTASEFELQFAPRWILDKAFANEKANYTDCLEEVALSDLPKNSNVISSHHFFQVKHDGEEGTLRLKCRLVPHGNRDKDKDSVRKDSATAQFPVVRVVLSIAAFLGMILATIDVKGAYLQGGYLSRDIYVRPPKGWASARRIVWRLLKAAYGIVEAGRIWQRTVEAWMLEEGIEAVPGLPQLFVKRRLDGRIVLVMAKVTDDFLIAGLREDIEGFYRSISKRFKIGRYIIDKDLIFNRLHIKRTEKGAVHVNMQEYFEKIMKLDIPRSRRKETDSLYTQKELTAYLGLAGKLNFLGHGILPQAAYAASRMQQAVGHLKVSDLVDANSMLGEVQNLKPSLTYPHPTNLNASPIYLAFSDASHGSHSYGQTGYVSEMYLSAGGESVYHVLDWHSSKQSRVSFPSIGAEIIAAASSTDRASLMAESMRQLYGSQDPPTLVLTVDLNGLYSTITTLHEGMDYRLRPTVSRLRDSFEVGEIGLMQWIPGKLNPADALTKRTVHMYRLLNETMTQGRLDESMFRSAKRVIFTS